MDGYLEAGELFARYDGDLKSVCVVTRIDGATFELKNIATDKKYQGQEYDKALVNHILDRYKAKDKTMLVGTGENPNTISFYKNCGVEPSHRDRDFFKDNCDHPIFEDGVQLMDTIYLKKL